jgi:hypothetical protein
MDHDCSKAAIFIPCNETISAEGVAELYLCYVFPRYGLPLKIISDRDPQFPSKFMKELLRLIGAKANTSTAYHPRTNGQSEMSNQFLGQFLRPWVNVQQNNWEPYLPIAEFAHNSWRNETTKQSPFMILMGYKPRAEVSSTPTSLPILELRRDVWNRAREDTERFILQAQQRWAQSKKEGRTFKERDQVWLKGRNLHLDQPSAKLAPKCHGPFIVKQVLSPITYQLMLPHQWKIHDVFHVDLLTPYIETDFHSPNYTRPPPDLVDGEEEYEVEKILKSRCYGRGHKVQYLVKWKGYADSNNEWVNWDDMHAEEAIVEFRRQQPQAETHIRRATHKAESTTQLPMSTNTSCTATTVAPQAQDLAEAIVHFPAVVPGSPDHSSASPITVFTHTPSPAGTPENPITVTSHSPSPGTVLWLPLMISSHDPSPYMPTDPHPTPEKGVDQVPVASLGSRPGSPIPGTLEYNYDLTSPPSPNLPSSLTIVRLPHLKLWHTGTGCTNKCFDITYTLHHHDHLDPSSDKANHWTLATLIEDQTLKSKRVWGYAMNYKLSPRWDLLWGEPLYPEDDDEQLLYMIGENLQDLTRGIQCGR